jgi:hypothetical protein
MPRCQRTFRRLGPGDPQSGSGATRWVCSFCPDAEVYEAVFDTDLLHYSHLAEASCRADFGEPSDAGRPTHLLFGQRPECVREPEDRRYDLYLHRNSDPFQLRLQIGHEMFHRVCSQGRVFHWTHEMLACLVSVRLLRQYGMEDYAAQMEREYETQAERLAIDDMMRSDLTSPPYPEGLYGRAYVTGRSLSDAAGWHALCLLGRVRKGTDVPDVAGWARRLSLEGNAQPGRILGITHARV